MSSGILRGVARLVDAESKRSSSYDRTGGNADFVKVPKGGKFTLADIKGSGVVTHIWVTISSKDALIRRNLVFRCFWDGQDHPSVECPIGDFFGNGWGMQYNFASLPLAATPREGHALVCYFPMPFAGGARIEVENQGSEPIDSLYFYVDYEKHASIPNDLARFHAQYRQEFTCPESETGDVENEWEIFAKFANNPTDTFNYKFALIEGRGHFVGVNYYVNCPTPVWYGEGDDMFLVDGEAWPGSAHGTGTEDYFNQSWCPDEVFLHPYFGTARVPGVGNSSPKFGWLGRTHVFRFHLEDPIRFTKSLRASIEHGHANCLSLELASVAYWYQTLPSKPFEPLPDVLARTPRPEIGAVDVHRWRDAWREARGRGALWGTERDEPR